jgi:hypothetical protein
VSVKGAERFQGDVDEHGLSHARRIYYQGFTLGADVNETIPVVVRVVFDPIEQKNKRKFEEKLTEYQEQVKNLRDRT